MDKNEHFKLGDLVKLKSGGPVMTVKYIRDGQDNECVCVWFTEKKEVISKHFNQATLMKIENNKE
ncbi:MAG: DUF2158 domain-containing protein [Bacteroidia bacterium]